MFKLKRLYLHNLTAKIFVQLFVLKIIIIEETSRYIFMLIDLRWRE
jgi:hypothetical protein